MNPIARWYFNQPGGMYREFEGLAAHFEPKDLSLYQKLLPRPFVLPERPVVTVFFADYQRVTRWPIPNYRYQEWAVLLKSVWKGEEGWYFPAIAVTGWLAMVLGRYLGFPKHIAEISLSKMGETRLGTSRYQGLEEISLEYCPGLSRPLVPWEQELIDNPSFFKGDGHLLVPPARGPRAQKIVLRHIIPPRWSPEPGMIRVRVHPAQPWAGLVPEAGEFPGTYNHFIGGMNLIAE